MTTDARGEHFRAGVGIVIERHDRLVLAMERADVPGAWQLPQGGLDPDEDSVAAAWRELEEETGLDASAVELVRASDGWFGYELPETMRSAKTGRGQVHRWFLFRLRPGVTLPPRPPSESNEFVAWRWISPRDLIEITVTFRRPEYLLVRAWLEAEGEATPRAQR